MGCDNILAVGMTVSFKHCTELASGTTETNYQMRDKIKKSNLLISPFFYPSADSSATCLLRPASGPLLHPISASSHPSTSTSDFPAASCAYNTSSETASCLSHVNSCIRPPPHSHRSPSTGPIWACACPLGRRRLRRQCAPNSWHHCRHRRGAILESMRDVSGELQITVSE